MKPIEVNTNYDPAFAIRVFRIVVGVFFSKDKSLEVIYARFWRFLVAIVVPKGPQPKRWTVSCFNSIKS